MYNRMAGDMLMKSKIILIMTRYFITVVILILFFSFSYGSEQTEQMSRILKMGIAGNVPLAFRNDKGQAEGVYVDLLEYIAVQENWEIEYVFGNINDLTPKLDSGEIDIFVLAYTYERQLKYIFNEEVIINQWAEVLVDKDSEITSLFDLRNKKIACVENDAFTDGPQGIVSINDQLELESEIIMMEYTHDAVEAVVAGNADAAVANRLHAMLASSEYEVKRSGIVFSPVRINFAMKIDNPASKLIIEKIDYYITDLRDDQESIYYTAVEKHLGNPATVVITTPKWLQYIYYLVGLMFLFVLSNALMLRWQVRNKTAVLRKVNEELRMSEQRFRKMFEESNIGIKLISIDGRIIQANPAFCSMIGYNSEKLKGMKTNDLIPEEELSVNKENYSRLINGEVDSLKTELSFVNSNNERIETISYKSIINDQYGKPQYILSIAEDITERKKAENELLFLHNQTEQFSRTAARMITQKDENKLFDSISNAIVQYSDYKRVLISYFKDEPPYREIISYAGLGEDIIEKLRNVHMPSVWYEEIFNKGIKLGQFSSYIPHTMKHILKKEATVFGEGEAGKAKDSWHPEDNLIVQMRDEKGNFIGVISVDESKSGKKPTKDTVGPLEVFSSLISQAILNTRTEKEKSKLEEQLYKAQKMESIGRLAGGIAHDFNNVLTSIMGYAELLSLKFNDTSTPEGEAAGIIIQGTERASDLTKQLLGFARGGKYNPVPLNINSVIQNVVKVSEKIFEKSIEVVYELEESIHNIEADKNQLDQVLTNLIINARDAMPEGGKVIFATENTEITQDVRSDLPELIPGRYVKLVVTDTGIGMLKEVREKIFEPFYTTKGKGKGTGLGLATVYGIITNHNGYVFVDSEPGIGTSFTIYLPVTDRELLEEVIEKDFIKGDAVILIVDDEQSVRDLAQKMLSLLGYSVLTADDGNNAVQFIREKKDQIDLVIVDMIMPNLGGKETIIEMKKIAPDLRIVLASGYSQDGKALDILEGGNIEFIQKPFRMQELSEVISKALKN